ncbi:MAG: recombinase family protein [Treponema sp.]
MYGYDQKSTGTAKITTPNKPQLEIVKECFSRYLSGESLIQIGKDIFLDTMNNQLATSQKVKQIITHEEYTGQNLTVDGAEIEKEFSEGRLADLEELRKDLYWANSVYYTEKVIDRDSWIKAREKMEWNRRLHAKPQTGNKRETEKSLASGFLKCYGCGNRFYLKDLRQYKKSIFYYHLRPTVECKQKRNILAEKLDTIIDVFYTFYYLLLDNTDDRLRKMKLEIKAELKKTEKELNKLSSERNKKQKIIDNLETELASGNYESVSVIVKLIEKTTNEMVIIDEQLRLSNLALYETKRKDAELSRNEKYKASTIEKITKWFELREAENFSELRILFREILFDGFMWINGNVIEITSGDPGRVFYFDVTNDYRIIYPFIEKLIDRPLSKDYSKIEKAWIESRKDKIEAFADKINAFLVERPNRKSDEELFQGNGFLFLSDCFDNVGYGGNGINLYTNKETELNETNYITTEKAAEIIGKSVSTVKLWGYHNGIEAISGEDGIKRLMWSEDDIERYKNARHTPRGFTGHKHSEETKKHFSEIRKGIDWKKQKE